MEKSAKWEDVKAKGEAIVAAGGVEIINETANEIEAYVMSIDVADRFPVSDGGPYHVILSKRSWENQRNVGGWIQGYLCDCTWGFYNSGEPGPRHQGRFCAHAYSALLVANARARSEFMNDRTACVKEAEQEDFGFHWTPCRLSDGRYVASYNGRRATLVPAPKPTYDLQSCIDEMRAAILKAYIDVEDESEWESIMSDNTDEYYEKAKIGGMAKEAVYAKHYDDIGWAIPYKLYQCNDDVPWLGLDWFEAKQNGFDFSKYNCTYEGRSKLSNENIEEDAELFRQTQDEYMSTLNFGVKNFVRDNILRDIEFGKLVEPFTGMPVVPSDIIMFDNDEAVYIGTSSLTNAVIDPYKKVLFAKEAYTQPRVLEPGSREYEYMQMLCRDLNRNSDSVTFAVEDVYFDYGQNLMWTTIVAREPHAFMNAYSDEWQVLDPVEFSMVCDGNIFGAFQRIFESEYAYMYGFSDGYDFLDRAASRTAGDYFDGRIELSFDDMVPMAYDDGQQSYLLLLSDDMNGDVVVEVVQGDDGWMWRLLDDNDNLISEGDDVHSSPQDALQDFEDMMNYENGTLYASKKTGAFWVGNNSYGYDVLSLIGTDDGWTADVVEISQNEWSYEIYDSEGYCITDGVAETEAEAKQWAEVLVRGHGIGCIDDRVSITTASKSADFDDQFAYLADEFYEEYKYHTFDDLATLEATLYDWMDRNGYSAMPYEKTDIVFDLVLSAFDFATKLMFKPKYESSKKNAAIGEWSNLYGDTWGKNYGDGCFGSVSPIGWYDRDMNASFVLSVGDGFTEETITIADSESIEDAMEECDIAHEMFIRFGEDNMRAAKKIASGFSVASKMADRLVPDYDFDGERNGWKLYWEFGAGPKIWVKEYGSCSFYGWVDWFGSWELWKNGELIESGETDYVSSSEDYCDEAAAKILFDKTASDWYDDLSEDEKQQMYEQELLDKLMDDYEREQSEEDDEDDWYRDEGEYVYRFGKESNENLVYKRSNIGLKVTETDGDDGFRLESGDEVFDCEVQIPYTYAWIARKGDEIIVFDAWNKREITIENGVLKPQSAIVNKIWSFLRRDESERAYVAQAVAKVFDIDKYASEFSKRFESIVEDVVDRMYTAYEDEKFPFIMRSEIEGWLEQHEDSDLLRANGLFEECVDEIYMELKDIGVPLDGPVEYMHGPFAALAGKSHAYHSAYIVVKQQPSGLIRNACSYCDVTVDFDMERCPNCGSWFENSKKTSSVKSATRTFTYAEMQELEDEVIDKPWLNNADRLKNPDMLASF